MSANILVIEYEPRYLEHVRAALAGGSFRLEIAGNLDDAVNRCASFEPTVVIITSVLPNLKVEDAITQLRARAGLRVTPFLILMSGYQGDSPAEDAIRYGAQDILQRPFGRDDLRGRVEMLVESAPNPAATQAIPQEMLEALRKSAGLDGDGQPVTSDDLFGDILSDVEGGELPPVPAPEGPPSAKPPAPVKAPDRAAKPDTSEVDEALSGLLDTSKPVSSAEVRREAEEAAEKMLSETLSGLEIEARAAKAVKATQKSPAEKPHPEEPPPVEPVKPPETAKAKTKPEKAQPPSAAPKPPPARVKPASSEPAPTPGPSRDAKPPAGEPSRPPAQGKEPTSEVPAVEGTQFGQYVIEEHIATGGMAEVYKARMVGMEGFQKTVAIKRILSNLTDSEEFVRMFIDEAKLAAQLNHNNIIHIYDLGKVDRSHYIAMEFIEGRDLRTILSDCREKSQRIPIPLALHVTMLLASALDYAHKKRDFENRELGLVHRDVSPQNVLISFEGDVKLCDFGIAKAASKATQTRAGALKGKLQYMSPEQAWGKNIDHRSDLFSLGLVLYEMLTSQKVFAGDSELSVLEQVRDPIIAAPSSHYSELDPEIDRIVFKALHADREERYQSALEIRGDLERLVRANEWSPDRAAIAAFLAELDGRLPAPAPAPAPDTTAAPPPPQPPGDGGEVFDVTPSPEPTGGEPVAVGEPDEELERALGADLEATPTPLLDEFREETASGFRKPTKRPLPWILVGVAAVLVISVAGWWWFFGRDDGTHTDQQPAQTTRVAPLATETPTPEPETGLMSEEELIDQARAVAAAEIVKQEEALRQRLEEEFPTPTPIPPTWTPTETATPTATPTATQVPPTATTIPTATPVPPTATPAVREGDIVASGPGVIPPVPIQRPTPGYPRMARRYNDGGPVGGTVEAEALVGIDGSVEEVRILKVDGPKVGFERATEEAVMKWRYKPATKLGVKVRMWVSIRVPFRSQ